ncbi:hypothetical protein [Clostridium sp.]|jgi:hypothetical protein|uniref:hypothetical protein n=1 Tax=Clostridium sp. TaxID=1506 RepID=UPI003A5C6102
MIKKGSLVEVESTGRNGIKVIFRGLCRKNCDIGEYVSIKIMSGHIISGIVYRDMNFLCNVHHLSKKAKQIIMIKSF